MYHYSTNNALSQIRLQCSEVDGPGGPWLTHWGRVTHICVSKLTIIGSDNGLSPGRRQVIIWTNDGILLIRTLLTNFSENLSEIHSFSFKNMYLKMSSAKWCLSRLGFNELSTELYMNIYGIFCHPCQLLGKVLQSTTCPILYALIVEWD